MIKIQKTNRMVTIQMGDCIQVSKQGNDSGEMEGAIIAITGGKRSVVEADQFAVSFSRATNMADRMDRGIASFEDVEITRKPEIENVEASFDKKTGKFTFFIPFSASQQL